MEVISSLNNVSLHHFISDAYLWDLINNTCMQRKRCMKSSFIVFTRPCTKLTTFPLQK